MGDRRRRRIRPLWRRIRAVLLSATISILRRGLGLFGWRGSQAIGRTIGRLYWYASRRERTRALAHLESAFPERSPTERLVLARACFRHLGMVLTECLYLWGKSPERAERYLRVEGFEAVEAVRTDGRPLLFLTAHCGNWELLAPVLAERGVKLSAVVRSMDGTLLNRQLHRLRAHFGTEILERGRSGSARQLLGVLRRGGSLTLLIDQDIDADGAWVPFFGRLAFTPTGAAQIALRRGARVIPAFLRRLEDGTHLATFQPALDLPDDPIEATALMTASIEDQIRRAPTQWVWMHRRWRRRPPSEDPPAGS